MNKEFYYLDGKEQKGPYSIDQLKDLNLKSDTLIWEESFDNWKQLKEVEELKSLLKKVPPPPPIIDTNVSSKKESDSEKEKVILGDSNVKLWTTLKIFFFSIVAVGLAAFIGYSLHNSKKTELKNQIYSKIDRIFDGKTVILDGQNSLAVGELKETGYDPKGTKKKDDDDIFSGLFTEWWEREKLYSIYEATSGGFTIKQLTRQNEDGFDIETIYSEDMGYKKPARTYVPPSYMDIGYGERYKTGGGYWRDNYKLSVRECYRETFNYFTEDDRKSPGAYSPGKFVDITNFPDIRNEYFYIDNTEPRQYSSSSVFSSEWESSGDHGANINTEDWAVYYKTYGKHYELTENESATQKDFLTKGSIGVGSVLFLLIVLLLSKPKFFRNLALFGKRWENQSYNEQILYFDHSFFGKNKFIEIINNNVSRGQLKITDSGATLNLSYPNKELFYKIESIEKNRLTLVSQKDNSQIEFLRVGSNEKVSDSSDNAPKTENETNETFE
jgi:hypothetical protein